MVTDCCFSSHQLELPSTVLDHAMCICSVCMCRIILLNKAGRDYSFLHAYQAAIPAGPLSAEPSFAFHCKSHLASASQGPPPSNSLQQLNTLPARSAAPDGSTSFDTQASLHQPYASWSTTQQQLSATNNHAAHHRQAAESSGQHNSSDLQQPNAWQAAPDCCEWEPLPPPADETADCHAAAWESSACTPQELADHLDKLKKEFRQIYSTILDGDAQLPEAAATVVSLFVNVRLFGVASLMIRTSSQACVHLACVWVGAPHLSGVTRLAELFLMIPLGSVYSAPDTIVKPLFVL